VKRIALLGRMGLALAVVLAALWPMAVEASVSRDVSFKASPLAAAKVLPQMQTPAEDALAKAALADECEALCELAASVDAAPLGYVSWRRPPIGIVFLYDDTSLLAEYDTNGNEVAKYDYGGDRLIRLTRSDEGTRYFSFDGLGSVTGLTDATGAVAAAYHLDAWGNYRFTSELAPSKNRFGFTGHYWDNEAGLYYAKARFYDPFTARFTQADSFLGNIDDPPSLHRYFYAHGNPTFFVDPTGLAAKITNALTIDGKGVAFGTDETTVIASPSNEQIQGMVNRGEITRSEAVIAMARNNTAPLAKTPDWQKSSDRLWVEGAVNQLGHEVTAPMQQMMVGGLNNDPVEIAEGGVGVMVMVLLPKGISQAFGALGRGLARLVPSWTKPLKLPRPFGGEPGARVPKLRSDHEIAPNEPPATYAPSAAEPRVASGDARFKRWQRGEAIDKPLPDGSKPSWDAVRSRYWKNRYEATKRSGEFSAANLEKMRRGSAPVDYNPRTGVFEARELHHVVGQQYVDRIRHSISAN